MLRGSSYTGGGGGGIGLPAAGVLKQSAVPASVTGTLSETTLATIAVPAGAMGVNGSLRITTLWSLPNNANTKSFKVRFGGIDFLGYSTTAAQSLQVLTIIRNRGAANSQVAGPLAVSSSYSSSVGAVTTSAIDTSLSQSIVLAAQLGNTADAVTLEAYAVEILNP